MQNDEQIFYLRQEIRRSPSLLALSKDENEVRLIAHFYVRTDDSTNAGGVAGTFQVEQGFECVEYICLPQPVSRSQIGEHETEHIEAFELAEKQGFAVVLSAVLTW